MFRFTNTETVPKYATNFNGPVLARAGLELEHLVELVTLLSGERVQG